MISLVGLALLSCSCGRVDQGAAKLTGQQSSVASATDSTHPDIDLPPKVFREMQDGRVRVEGHWVLKTSDPALKSNELPFAAQPLNSTIIGCSALTRSCTEYRATVIGRLLLPNDPVTYSVASWDRERLVASWTGPTLVECVLRIDLRSKDVEMEYRRQPSADRRRVFERWVLE
ncbi:MAG: hypothetical protein ACRD1V_08895 [Vicinamibacterales bacterium]